MRKANAAVLSSIWELARARVKGVWLRAAAAAAPCQVTGSDVGAGGHRQCGQSGSG